MWVFCIWFRAEHPDAETKYECIDCGYQAWTKEAIEAHDCDDAANHDGIYHTDDVSKYGVTGLSSTYFIYI